MARVLYLVAGEGNGHATRSSAVIEELRARGHAVIAVSDGNALPILAKVADKVVEGVTPHMAYSGNKVLAWRTLFLNMRNLPRFVRDLFRIRKLANSFKPDMVVTDFNPMGSFLGRRPLVSIDNQGVITNADVEVPKGWFIEALKSKAVVRLVIPFASARLVSCFWDAPMRIDAIRIGPIVSRKVRSLKPKKVSPRSHVLVYQTSPTNSSLADILPKLEVEVRAYGFGRVGRIGKVAFMPFEDKRWHEDLASCRAVIVNGGFSLISEALALKKPILCFPIGHQFEQALNAQYLEREGLGVWGKEQTVDEIKRFLDRAESIQRNIRAHRFDDGSVQAADFIGRIAKNPEKSGSRLTSRGP